MLSVNRIVLDGTDLGVYRHDGTHSRYRVCVKLHRAADFLLAWDMAVGSRREHPPHRVKIAAAAFAIASLQRQAQTAQDKGTVNPKPLPPLANPDDPKRRPRNCSDGARPLRRDGALARFYAKVASPRRRDADQRLDLAGDAAVSRTRNGGIRL